MTDGVLFADATREPGEAELAAALGRRAALWRELETQAEAMGARGGWTWDGPKYGWNWRMKRSGKPFLSLTPAVGGFRALVILGRDASVEAATLPLGPGMRATYDAARQYPDGRWLFHPIESDEDVRDMLLLLRLKLPPTIRARFAAAAG